MVSPNAKTLNRKRKILENIEDETHQSPKKAKLNRSTKTPGKKNNTSVKAKTPIKQNNSGKTRVKKEKVESENKAPPKQLAKTKKNKQTKAMSKAFSNLKKKFDNGDETVLIQIEKKIKATESSIKSKSKIAKKQQRELDKCREKLSKLKEFKRVLLGQKPASPKTSRKKKQHQQEAKVMKRNHEALMERALMNGDKSVFQQLEAKISEIESRQEKSKTARRKLRKLNKLKLMFLGVKPTPCAPSKNEQHQQQAKAEETGATQKEEVPVVRVKKEEDDKSSDYELKTELIIDEISIDKVKLEVKVEPCEEANLLL